MTTLISNAMKTIARTSLAAAFGIALLGGTAAADTYSEHAKQMNQGKDHYAALDEVKRGGTAAGDVGAQHADQMNKGKDHYSALPATTARAAQDQTAAKHTRKMNEGKDHYTP